MNNFTLSHSTKSSLLNASSTAAGFDVSNLEDVQPGRKWRSVGVSESITVDFGVDVTLNRAGLLFHNLTSIATVRVRGASTEPELTINPVFDVTTTGWLSTHDSNGPKHAMSKFDNMTNRWWRLDITDNTNPDGFVEVGRLWLGHGWTSTLNPDWGMGEGLTDRGFQQFTASLDMVEESDWFEKARPVLRDFGWGRVEETDDGRLIPDHPDRVVLIEAPVVNINYQMDQIHYGYLRARNASIEGLDWYRLRLQLLAFRG